MRSDYGWARRGPVLNRISAASAISSGRRSPDKAAAFHELALVAENVSLIKTKWRVAGCLFAIAVSGCASEKKTSSRPTVAQPIAVKPTDPRPAVSSSASNTDPCASRMHDISGAMLLYYAMHQRLPPTLDELRTTPGGESLEPFVSPATGKPFLYNAVGVVDPKRVNQRLVLYEAEPSKGGYRWTITIVEPGGDAPLVARVVAIPESEFSFMGR